MDCCHLVKRRNKRLALMNTKMNRRVPQNTGNFLTYWGVFTSQVELSSTELSVCTPVGIS